MALTKKKIGVVIGVTFVFAVVGTSFQNCAKQEFSSQALVEKDDLTDSLEQSSENTPVQKTENGIEAKPIDTKQTVESMMSLLDLTTKDVNMTTLTSEINYRRNLLLPQTEMKLLSSPSVIAITSVAGVLCQQAVIKEKAGVRDIFRYIDFKKGPSSYGKIGALNTYIALSQRFWFRRPSGEELAYMKEAIDEYFNTLNSASQGSPAESEKLAIFICTGMLSVPDSYLL